MKEKKSYLLILFLIGLFLISVTTIGKDEVWIEVGPNILASAEIEKYGRNECWIAASLEDPDFLIGISQSFSGYEVGDWKCPVIISHDGGQTWKDVQLPGGHRGFDPFVLSGPDGIMYVMIAATPRWLGLYSRLWSTKDKGKTWLGPTEIYGLSLDHPRMAVDTTGGKYHGRIYFAWNEMGDTIEEGKYNIYLHYSDDEGKTFTGPIHLQKVAGGKLVMIEPLVLSDGTLIIPYYKFYYPLNDKKNEKKPLWILISNDGGNTFSKPQKVIDVGASGWLDVKEDFARAFTLPIATVNTSKKSLYKDRIYIVWDDYNRTGDSNIWLIWSANKGKTWTEPVRVNDNPSSSGKGPKDYRMNPVVAVNKEGIVGVAWYDRRDDPTRRCWDYYMAFSMDGGKTFEKNIKVSSCPSCADKNTPPSIRIANISPMQRKEQKRKAKENKVKESTIEVSFDKSRNVWPGHYTGLTTDAKGRFHPIWADRRNGFQQLYTAVVEVLSEPHEIPDLTETIDITNRVRLLSGHAVFNEEKSISTFGLQIQNMSQEPLYAPLKLRVKHIVIGWDNLQTLEILNPDNNKNGIGAVLDFSSLMGSEKRLDPKEITESKKIKIKTFIEAGLDGMFEFEVLGRAIKQNRKE